MFTDTPKLQPISKSKPKPSDNNVPSVGVSSSSNNNNASPNTSGGSINKNQNGTTIGDSNDNTNKDNRCNYGSYRSNNYQNQNYQKNYQNREFNNFQTNKFNPANKFKSHWNNSWNNQKYNHWNNNFKYNNKNFRNNNNNFAENKNNASETLAEDAIPKIQTETVKNKTPANNNKITTPKNKNSNLTKNKNSATITKQVPTKQNKFVQNQKPAKVNNFQKNKQNSNKSINAKTTKIPKIVENSKPLKKICETQIKPPKTNKNAKNLATNNLKKLAATEVNSEIPAKKLKLQEEINKNDKLVLHEEINKNDNLVLNNLSAIASNAKVLDNTTEKEFLISNTATEFNSTADTKKHSNNNSIELLNNNLTKENLQIQETLQLQETLQRPLTVLQPAREPALESPSETNSTKRNTTTSLSENENFEFHIPKISLIPISRLIATEFWDTAAQEPVSPEISKPLSTTVNSNTPSHKQLFKPNLIKRKRNVSTCSNSSSSSQTNSATDRIVDKLVTMNKINLKNIINSSETKYDEALKTQARKRLREEIRRQLKSMNIQPPKDPISTDFVPDEIVDSIDIPDVVFDEIRKALGLELFNFSEDISMRTIEDILSNTSGEGSNNIRDSYIPNTPAPVPEDLFTLIPTEFLQQPISKETPNLTLPPLINENVLTSPKSNNLPSPQKDLQEVKCEIKPNLKDRDLTQKSEKSCKKSETRTKSKKLTKRKESRKTKRHQSPKRIKEDVVVLITSSSESSTSSSSSSSSTSSSSSSSSDSETDTSAHSSGSSAKRRRLKRKVDAENVVDSFEKLILTSLSESLRDRYHSKYSNSISTKLHFISCICTSDYNSEKFTKLQIAKIQKNLKSSDCSMALEFLMKEIVNVFNKQKLVAKLEDSRKSSRGHIEATKENSQELSPTKKNTHGNNETPTKVRQNNVNVFKTSTSTTSSPASSASSLSSASTSEALKAKSVNAAQKVTNDCNGEKHIQECVTKVLSLYRQEMKAAMQSKETGNQPTSPQKSTAEHQTRKEQTRTSVNSSSSSSTTMENKNAGQAKENDERNLTNPINPINQQLQPPQQQQQQQHENGETVNDNRNKDNESQQQQHQPSTNPLTNVTRQCNTPEEKKFMNDSLQIIQMPSFSSNDYSTVSSALNNYSSSLMGVSSSCYNQQPSFPMVDLEALKKQSPIGEVVVNNLREIDFKLMELHKRKMYIEEMILKLQKDKMEADLLTIKLQNEKFILLNTAMTANVTSTSNVHEKNINEKSESHTLSSSVRNIKTESIILTEAMSVSDKTPKLVSLANDKSPKTRKKVIKSRPVVRKAAVAKKVIINRKRKTPAKKTFSISTKQFIKKSHQATIKQNNKTTSKDDSISDKLTLKAPATPVLTTPPKSPLENSSKNSKPITDINKNLNNRFVNDSSIKTACYKNMPTGSFEGIRNPITQIRVFDDFIVASSEDGKLYKFDVATLKLLVQFSKHSEAITQMYLCGDKKVIYTTSLDGYLKKSSLENFALDIQSIYLQEPLQSIDIQWDQAFIGSRWGNIITYNLMTNSVSENPLCSTDSSIISIKATTEGTRKILIVSSKGNLIHLRDATSGILLRTFNVPESINIYSILLNDGIIYCGTQKKEIRKYDFMSGANMGVMTCGNGAVSMQMYNNKYIFVGCYDGFIYILDKTTGKQLGRLAGSGKMILTLEIVEDKIITSAKDNTMKVTDIPSYCLDNKST